MQILCSVCKVRIPTQKVLEAHMAKRHPEIPYVAPELPVEEIVPETLPPEPMVSDKIVLNFRQPVEITINGTPYSGKTIEVSNMGLATEIVRIAREAYGDTILA